MRSWYYLRGFRRVGELTSAGIWPITVSAPDVHVCRVVVMPSNGAMIAAKVWARRAASMVFDQGCLRLDYTLPLMPRGECDRVSPHISIFHFTFTGGTIRHLPCPDSDTEVIMELRIPRDTRFTLRNNS